MSEGTNYIPEPPENFQQAPEKKKNKTLWIIIAVIAVILLCCCLVVVLGLVLGAFSYEEFDQLLYQTLPYLSLI